MLSAGDMLERPGLPVPVIAVRLGCGSEMTFSRAFKRAFNMSHTHYRQHDLEAGPSQGSPVLSFARLDVDEPSMETGSEVKLGHQAHANNARLGTI